MTDIRNQRDSCVLRIWAKAWIETQLYRNCIRMLENLWIQWNDIDKQKTGKDDEKWEGFSRKMDSLCDSVAEGVVQQIMLSILLDKKEKKKEIEFH